MKKSELILRVLALILSLASLIILIVVNIEYITDALACLSVKIKAKKEQFCGGCEFADGCDDDEFEDWDD